MNSSILGVIPARFASLRLPGKPLAIIAGKPMIQHVYERAKQAQKLDKVVVATDDLRILEAVRAFGGVAQMTRPDHPSGSDRVAEVAEQSGFEFVVNIQGDEPFLSPLAIDAAIEKLLKTPEAAISTLVTGFSSATALHSPNTAKVVLTNDDFALYFSRSAIPYHRDMTDHEAWLVDGTYFQHIGLYVFRREMLRKFVELPVCDLERIEKLEQLRALNYGFKIVCAKVDYHSFCVDTPEDLQEAQLLAKEQGFDG